MIRCKTCNKFHGELSQPKIGEMVDFVIERGNGRSRRISVRTGKLMLIKEDGFSVIYRGTVYHSDAVSCPDDPSPLTLAFVGICDCKKENLMTNKTQIADGAVCKGSLQLGSGCGRCSRCKAEIRSVFAKLEAAEARNALVAGGIEAAVKLQERAEKAEARIAGIEKNLDAALLREKRVERQLLAKEAELAAMRGDAVPVAVVEWSDYIVFGQPPRVAVRELSPGALELAMGKSLFTHGQPAPVENVDDLVMQIRRLVQALRMASPDNKLPGKVSDYMRRKAYFKNIDCLRAVKSTNREGD